MIAARNSYSEKNAHGFLGGHLSVSNFFWREVHTIVSNCVKKNLLKWVRAGEESDHSIIRWGQKYSLLTNFEPYPTNELVLCLDGESNAPQRIFFGYMVPWPSLKCQKNSFCHWPLTPGAQNRAFDPKPDESEETHGGVGMRVTDEAFKDWFY